MDVTPGMHMMDGLCSSSPVVTANSHLRGSQRTGPVELMVHVHSRRRQACGAFFFTPKKTGPLGFGRVNWPEFRERDTCAEEVPKA